MRWDCWNALASKKWLRMEDSGRVDDEGEPILERVDLMEAFFAGVPCMWLRLVFLLGLALGLKARPMASP